MGQLSRVLSMLGITACLASGAGNGKPRAIKPPDTGYGWGSLIYDDECASAEEAQDGSTTTCLMETTPKELPWAAMVAFILDDMHRVRQVSVAGAPIRDDLDGLAGKAFFYARLKALTATYGSPHTLVDVTANTCGVGSGVFYECLQQNGNVLLVAMWSARDGSTLSLRLCGASGYGGFLAESYESKVAEDR